MVHPSCYLAYCWHLSHISQSSKDEQPKKPAGSFTGRRRQKFREQRGPSREELQRSRIVSILRQIPVLGRKGLERFTEFREEFSGDSLPLLVNFSTSAVNIVRKSLEAFGNGIDRTGLERRNDLPHEVLWPLFAVTVLGEEERLSIDWDGMPTAADPLRGGGYKALTCGKKNNLEAGDEVPWHDGEEDEGRLRRGERKRSQVYTIAAILKGSVIADFGCGSGALSLPLASLFPEHIFVCVDYKQESIRLLNQRAQRADLANVMMWHGRIEDYLEPFDVCVALHACGKATDLALLQALKHSAAYIVSPCCVGKLRVSIPFSSSHDVQQGFCKTRILRPNMTNSEERKDSGSIVACLGTENGSYESSSSQCHHNCLNNAVPVCLSVKKTIDALQFRDLTSEIEFAALGDSNIRDQKADMDSLMLEGFNSSRLNDKKASCPLEITVTYPRSNWLCSVLSSDDFMSLVRMADWSSYDYDSCDSVLHTVCKLIVELDRNEALQEHGYRTQLVSLSDQKAGVIGVAHVLVGRPFVEMQ